MLSKISLLLFLALPAVTLPGSAQSAADQGTPHHYYLDCGAADGGAGLSPQSPWNSLDPLNATPYQPGDVIAIRRGTTCHGALAPIGSGSETAPIRLTAYGEGPRPRIIADPKTDQALRLFNQQYWDIDSLDLTGGRTHGVFISGDHGILHHIHLANLAVHNVEGGDVKHKESGLVAISPTSANAHFDDVVVDNVTAWNTNQWVGILVGGGDLGFPPESVWNTNISIRNSAIHDVQGDGIVLFRVRNGRIDSSVAWNTGMQPTESIGTPNAIWTWMCDDCVVQDSEAFLTDSPGVDGGAFDIDYGNTNNSVIDNYGHDTQGYCVAVFGAGFVTHQSLVRGNLCIDNGRSPRMGKTEGAIYIYTWNNGSIDGLTVENNTVQWNPLNNAPPLVNHAAIAPGTAVFRNNSIESTAVQMIDSNASLSLAQNKYRYYGVGNPEWRYSGKRFPNLRGLQAATHQEGGSVEMPLALRLWPPSQPRPGGIWKLTCAVPVALTAQGLIDDDALRQITILRSQAAQYFSSRLETTLQLTSPDPHLFASAAFRNAVLDLDLANITVSPSLGSEPAQTALRGPDGKVVAHWDGFAGPVALGAALRQSLGAPFYSQMDVHPDEPESDEP
ncbi:MAG TPA: right-handed parallel beta-helix repeat-containing protein [Acidobacteriaceae bacterium]|jgi:hypothetical protein|nr:right-handed parallel beta-helix repeat-containing protein [Acidobacteriaceae bacterium]